MCHQIREDVKSGVYVENLTEEYVKNLTDVSQLLIKVCYSFWFLTAVLHLKSCLLCNIS